MDIPTNTLSSDKRADGPAQATGGDDERIQATSAPVNILLVDDEPRNLDVLESILETPGFRLIRAQTAEETLMALIKNDFAAIVLDVRMPDMSGLDLARLIKQRKRNRHIPIIFLTAYFQEDKDVITGYGIGAVDYLTKPVNPQVLRSKISVFVDLFRANRALVATNAALEQEVLQRQRVELALHEANQALEERVMERTADLEQLNRELRESRERYRLVFENALEYAIFTLDNEGRVNSWNAGAQRVLGFEESEVIGRRLDMTFTLDQQQSGQMNRELEQARTDGRSHAERWRLRKDGSAFWATSLVMRLDSAEGVPTGFLKILRDCTAQKQSEQERRETEVLRVSEREQRRISQDLHDGLGQQLAGISCLTDALKKDLAGDNSPHVTLATRISGLLNVAVAQARSLARGLQPVAEEANGLMSALDDLAVRASELFKVSCTFDCRKAILIENNAAATHLYRIAQEAVTNSVKHGRAQNIKIKLSSTKDRILLTIDDDGSGFNKSADRREGLGLQIMNHRAGLIGGEIAIQKRQGGGTEVVCSVGINSINKRTTT